MFGQRLGLERHVWGYDSVGHVAVKGVQNLEKGGIGTKQVKSEY